MRKRKLISILIIAFSIAVTGAVDAQSSADSPKKGEKKVGYKNGKEQVQKDKKSSKREDEEKKNSDETSARDALKKKIAAQLRERLEAELKAQERELKSVSKKYKKLEEKYQQTAKKLLKSAQDRAEKLADQLLEGAKPKRADGVQPRFEWRMKEVPQARDLDALKKRLSAQLKRRKRPVLERLEESIKKLERKLDSIEGKLEDLLSGEPKRGHSHGFFERFRSPKFDMEALKERFGRSLELELPEELGDLEERLREGFEDVIELELDQDMDLGELRKKFDVEEFVIPERLMKRFKFAPGDMKSFENLHKRFKFRDVPEMDGLELKKIEEQLRKELGREGVGKRFKKLFKVLPFRDGQPPEIEVEVIPDNGAGKKRKMRVLRGSKGSRRPERFDFDIEVEKFAPGENTPEKQFKAIIDIDGKRYEFDNREDFEAFKERMNLGKSMKRRVFKRMKPASRGRRVIIKKVRKSGEKEPKLY